MREMQFKPRFKYDGQGVTGIPAQVVGERLEEIAAANEGLISPQAVVDDARQKASPLHGAFEWNVRKAAEAHWISRAQQIIRCVVRVKDEAHDPEDAPKIIQAYVAVGTKESGSRYMASVRAFSNVETRELVLTREIAQLKGWRRRNEHLEELANVFAAIDELAPVEVPA